MPRQVSGHSFWLCFTSHLIFTTCTWIVFAPVNSMLASALVSIYSNLTHPTLKILNTSCPAQKTYTCHTLTVIHTLTTRRVFTTIKSVIVFVISPWIILNKEKLKIIRNRELPQVTLFIHIHLPNWCGIMPHSTSTFVCWFTKSLGFRATDQTPTIGSTRWTQSSSRNQVGETFRVALNSTMGDDCHIVTPLILSEPLTRLAGQKVYLKLDSLQPSGISESHVTWRTNQLTFFMDCALVPGSFKIRGIGRTCSHAVANLGATRLVGSSGGSGQLRGTELMLPKLCKQCVLKFWSRFW